MSIMLFVFEPCLLLCVIFSMSYLYVLVPGKIQLIIIGEDKPFF